MPVTSLKSSLRALRERKDVMLAVMLRDMRTRFFNHGLGFLIVPLWPLAHLLALLAIYNFGGRRAPYGTGLRLFFVTGLIPTLSFVYVSRFMAISILANKNMMAFPIVKPIDIMGARAALEMVGSCLMVAMVFIFLLVVGDNPVPYDIPEAVSAFFAVLLLAVGVGSVVSVLVMTNYLLMTAYSLFMILMYILSGTLFVVSSLPAPLIKILSWNPVLHCVEWMRTAYFPSYPTQVLDKGYPIKFALCSLLLGLLLERVLRRYIFE